MRHPNSLREPVGHPPPIETKRRPLRRACRVWVGDAVVILHDGCGGEIFCYEPADVTGGRIMGSSGVGGAERALVAAKKCRASGARRFFLYAYPGLTAWAKLWRTSGAWEKEDAAFGLGALKRRPYE
jgi:hypothetical protein